VTDARGGVDWTTMRPVVAAGAGAGVREAVELSSATAGGGSAAGDDGCA
jgi:hypothetical protein